MQNSLAKQVVSAVKLYNDSKYHSKEEVLAAANKKHLFGQTEGTMEQLDALIKMARNAGAEVRAFHRPIKYTDKDLKKFATAYNKAETLKECKEKLQMDDKTFTAHIMACRNHGVELKKYRVRLSKDVLETIKSAVAQ